MNIRLDYRIIADIVEHGSKVLDLGCGEGDLMLYLQQNNKAITQGIELDENAIYKCVEKGLSVFHSDIDSGLKGYPDKVFNYIILNQSLQEVKKVDYVIQESLRVAEKVIIGFPNFAHINSRLMILFKGKVPVFRALPYKWYDTPNLRFFSIADFKDYCAEKKVKVLASHCLGKGRKAEFLPNLFASNAVFVISK